MKNNKEYQVPSISVICFDNEDIVTASTGMNISTYEKGDNDLLFNLLFGDSE